MYTMIFDIAAMLQKGKCHSHSVGEQRSRATDNLDWKKNTTQGLGTEGTAGWGAWKPREWRPRKPRGQGLRKVMGRNIIWDQAVNVLFVRKDAEIWAKLHVTSLVYKEKILGHRSLVVEYYYPESTTTSTESDCEMQMLLLAGCEICTFRAQEKNF